MTRKPGRVEWVFLDEDEVTVKFVPHPAPEATPSNSPTQPPPSPTSLPPHPSPPRPKRNIHPPQHYGNLLAYESVCPSPMAPGEEDHHK
ncbi:hypothetical protein CROQUDRAFT_91447 [Cronartium quercuum f. sp. fusiforme G11]|uniref:Uncharacterized protein n=1 Tax=Cronartium quercuum f. sp. fusiforme G11 TaxID=708437 RepID=A0A9P6NJZ9_9BASI|nr:hypothetical protein CROQUDRAFT_91447 [Cronartium quercuum f. sp. fusiforme G11]